MKRTWKILTFVLALMLMCCGCGDISSVERIVDDTELYSKAEIRSAMRVVESHFFREFSGCELLEISFDEEKTLKEIERNGEKGENSEVIVLTSSFYVEKSDGSLTPGMTYNGWSWELECTLLGTWKLADAGYA